MNSKIYSLNTSKGFFKINKESHKGFSKRYFSLIDGRVAKVIDNKDDDGKYVNNIYTDGYNSKELGRSTIRNSSRRQKFQKPPLSSIVQYALNQEIFDEFDVNINKCVVVNGCYETNRQTLKRQLIPISKDGDFFKYPTMDNLSQFDESVKALFRKVKQLGIIETQIFSDIFSTQVSPLKKPGFRFEEEFQYKTKKEAVKSALKLGRKRWNVSKKFLNKDVKREKIFPGVYTIGARKKLIDEDEFIYHVTEHLIDFDIKNY